MTIKDYADNMVKLLPEHYHGKIEITIVDSSVSAIHNTRSEKYGHNSQTKEKFIGHREKIQT